MSRRYAQVLPSFWTGETGSRLKGDLAAQLLAQYLISSPHANMLGLYRCPLAYMEEDLGIERSPLEGALKALERVGFAYFDPLTRVVFVPQMARIQMQLDPGEALKPGDNRVKSARALFAEIPECFLKSSFRDLYEEVLHLPPPEGPPKPLRSPSEAKEHRTGTESSNREQEQRAENKQHTVAQAPPSLAVVGPSPAALPEPKPRDRADEVRAVFEHYRGYHPRAHKKPNPKQAEWRKIRARLDEGCSVEDLKLAIDGCHVSPYHCGENERGRPYQNLELIVRDGSKVNQFIEALEQSKSPVFSEKTKRSIRAGQQWLEEMEARDAAGR